MNTITREWNKYRAQCFPDHLHPIQERELRQAWFASAISTFQAVQNATMKPESEAMTALTQIEHEIFAELQALVARKLHKQN